MHGIGVAPQFCIPDSYICDTQYYQVEAVRGITAPDNICHRNLIHSSLCGLVRVAVIPGDRRTGEQPLVVGISRCGGEIVSVVPDNRRLWRTKRSTVKIELIGSIGAPQVTCYGNLVNTCLCRPVRITMGTCNCISVEPPLVTCIGCTGVQQRATPAHESVWS